MERSIDSEPYYLISRGFQGLGVTEDIVQGLRLYADAADQDVASRGRHRVHQLLSRYKEPMFNRVEWKQKLVDDKQDFEDMEQEKARWRAIYKGTHRYEAAHPREYDAKKCPDINYCIETVDGKTFGMSPFKDSAGRTRPKELLQYEGKLVWSEFKNRCAVEIGDTDASNNKVKKLIFSLTLETLIQECQDRACNLDQLGRILMDFLKATIPDIATKINAHTEVAKEIFKNIESIVDIQKEIIMVEDSLNNVKRNPEESLNVAGNNFGAKQLILARLRATSGGIKDLQDMKVRTDRCTFQMMLELISPETRNYIINSSMRKHYSLGREYTLDLLYKEVSRLEEQNPSWRIKQPIYTQSRGMTNVPLAGAALFPIETETHTTQEEAPEFEFEDDYEFDDPANDLEEGLDGQMFLMDMSRTRGGVRPRGGRGGRGRGGRPARGGAAPGQGQSRGAGRPGGTGGPGQGRSVGGPTYCLRCGSGTHNHRACIRFGSYHATRCTKCEKRDPSKPLYHPPELCCYDENSGWVAPESRSPATKAKFGFPRSLPSSPQFARSKNM